MLNTLPGDSGVVIPDTRYTRTPDGFYIAYQVVGQGLIDFAWMPGFILGNVEVVWEHPLVEAFLGRFASIGRLIIHDRRGTGYPTAPRVRRASKPVPSTCWRPSSPLGRVEQCS